MTRYLLSRKGAGAIPSSALLLLLAACSGSGGTTKTPEEDDDKDDGTGTRGAGGNPDPNANPDPNDDDDDDDNNPVPANIDQKPTSFTLDVNSRRFVENTDTSSRIELATITITDDGQGTNSLSLSDLVRFVIDGGKLYLKASIDLDYETAPGHKHEVTLTLSATGTGRLPNPVTFTLHITNIDEAPVLSLSGSQTLPLNEGVTVTASDTGFMVTATDPDSGDTVTLTISDNRFEISGGKLQVKSGQTFDFETEPTVEVMVTASSNGKSASKTVTLQVTNIDEALVIAREDGTAVGASLAVDSPENQVAVIDLKATPTISGGVIMWSLEGADKDLFQIDGEGVITWRQSPDYETTLSNAGSKAFSLVAIASDSRDGVSADRVSITVNLTDIDEAGRIADFSATPVVGEKLLPPQITDPDSPGGVVIIKNQWQVLENEEWVEKSTDDGYTPTPDDVGKQVRLVVTYSDAFGSQTLTTKPSAAVTVATQSLFTNVQNANPYLAEAITYSANHEVAYFARQDGDRAVITTQDEAGLMTIQIDPLDSSRYEVIIPTVRRFDFETEFDNDHSYDFTVQLTRGGHTQSRDFSIPFKNAFGPNDGDKHNTKAQKFVPSANQWRELIGNEEHPTFDATRDADIINLMQSQGGYDPSFLFYFGNAAKDKVSGTAKDDIIYGNGGDDELYGEMGDDALYGGTGNDILDGGFRGENSLTGGRGADKFILYKGNVSTDTITDFYRSEGDKILYDHTTNSAADLAAIGLRKELNSDSNLQLVDAGNDHIYMIFDGLSQLSDITIADFELI